MGSFVSAVKYFQFSPVEVLIEEIDSTKQNWFA